MNYVTLSSISTSNISCLIEAVSLLPDLKPLVDKQQHICEWLLATDRNLYQVGISVQFVLF